MQRRYWVKRGLDVESMRKKLRKSDYVTAEKCRDCHSEIYDSWSKTSHSRAIKTLEKVNQEYDPECFSCHATGVMARNAYTNQKETPELANVQCEACHGPGRTHSESPDSGYGSTGEMACRSCHTEDRNPDFDYKKMWELIKH